MSPDLIVETVWKSTLCAALVLAALRFLRHRSAAERALLANLGLGAILMLPLAAALLPQLAVEAPAAVTEAYRNVVTAAPATTGQVEIAAVPAVSVASSGQLSWLRLAVLGWGIPAAALLLLTLVGIARLRLLRSQAEVLVDPKWLTSLAAAQRRLGFKHGTALLVSDRLQSPISWGILRPIIVIDAKAASAPERAEAIIAHELAHVARLDWLALLLGRLAVALFWFNPLVWLLARQSHDLSEQAADDVVLRSDVPAPDYAEVLVGAARHATAPLLLAANGVASGGSSLARRVIAVLDPARNRVPVRLIWAALCLAGTFSVATAVAAFHPHLPVDPAAPTAASRPFSPQAAALGRRLVEEIGDDHTDQARALIEAGADVNFVIEGEGTPLIVAVRKGEVDLVRRLIAAGADVNRAAPGDGNPLIAAADRGQMPVVAMLVGAGADVNGYVLGDETPLINAARENRIEAARYLIAQGADVNLTVDAPTREGVERRSPLGMARRGGHGEMERLLRSHGARS